MNLPEQLQKFLHPTLIVLADHVHATLWLTHELKVNQIDELSMPRERMSDEEEIENDTDPDRLHHMMKELASRISHHASNAQHIYLVMKTDLAHALEKEFGHDVTAKINRRLDADLMKEDILDVVNRLLKAWK